MTQARFSFANDETGWELLPPRILDAPVLELAGHVFPGDPETVQQVRSRYEAVILASGAIVWEWDPVSDRSTYAGAVEKLLGYTLPELAALGQWSNLIHPEDREGFFREIQRVSRSRGRMQHCYRVRRKTGEYIDVESIGHTLVTIHNELRLVGMVTDVTERKRAEDARVFLDEAGRLLTSSLDYDLTLSHIAQLAVPRMADWCTVDVAEGGPIRRLAVAHVDPAKEDIARGLRIYSPGKPANSLVARVFRDGEPILIPTVTDESLLATARDDHHLELLKRIDLKSIMVVPIRIGEQTVGAITFATAESARRLGATDLAVAEDLARRAAVAVENARLYRTAQEASRARDQFLAAVSHELRTPLNSILGWTQLLRAGSVDPGNVDRALEAIERNARMQSRIVGDILELSRVISGKLHLEPRPVDLLSVLDGTLESCRVTAGAKGIGIAMTMPAEAVQVWGDADRLQQVVWNLLSNALKFTPAGGKIHVAVDSDDTHVTLTVTDNGVGIPVGFLPFVFERFVQVDRSSSRAHGGLGLGLAIVRHLVELHGGTVSAESAGPGMGASFRVRLPRMLDASDAALAFCDGGKEEPAIPRLEDDQPLDGLTVLVLDDQDDAREVIAATLEIRGARVHTAATAAEAMVALDRVRPDVLVSDIGMPHEDGYSFLRRVRQRSPDCMGDVPAIALTAYATAEDRARALLAGFELHVAKPVEAPELVAAVASLAGRTRHR